jgi:hypothetical protein
VEPAAGSSKIVVPNNVEEGVGDMNLVTLWRRGLTGTGVARMVLAAGMAGAALLAAGQASAQRDEEWRDRGEVRRDTREMRVDRAQWIADRMDVRRLKRLVVLLDRAQASRDWREERRLRNGIHALLRQELYEAGRDLGQDRREEARSRDELRQDYQGGRDPRETRDDWRDLRDDRRDTAESRRRLMSQMEILRRLREIQPAVEHRSRSAMRHEDRLLHSFLKLAREDARADRREWMEDRRERREDVPDREDTRNREDAPDRDDSRDGNDWH